MPIAAGEILTAARLNRLQPKTYVAEMTGSNLALTSTVADVAGCSITVNTETANAVYVVQAVFDMIQVATTNNDAFGKLAVDGSTVLTSANFGGQVSGDRACVAQVWQGTLGAAGSHTLKLQANAQASSQYQVGTQHTKILLTILEVV